MSKTAVAVCISALLCIASLAAQNVNSLSAQERRDGFVPLFDGATTKGWHVLPLGRGEGMSDWIVKDGVLTYHPADMWLASDEPYADFELRLEYRTTGEDTDSGIFLRSAPAGYPSWTGMELEIKGNDAGQPPSLRTSMSLIGSAAPLKSVHNGPGAWNTVDVTLNKRRLVGIVNGETIHDFSLDDPAYAVDTQHTPLAKRVTSGFIGFQCHTTVAPAEYRNIRIKVIK